MKLSKIFCSLAFAGAVLSLSAHAQFSDGNKLLKDMNGNVYHEGIALGYVMGVTDFGAYVTHCPPNNATAGQIRDMVKQHLIDFPQNRHMSADILIMRVLATAWPCPKKGTGI